MNHRYPQNDQRAFSYIVFLAFAAAKTTISEATESSDIYAAPRCSLNKRCTQTSCSMLIDLEALCPFVARAVSPVSTAAVIPAARMTSGGTPPRVRIRRRPRQAAFGKADRAQAA